MGTWFGRRHWGWLGEKFARQLAEKFRPAERGDVTGDVGGVGGLGREMDFGEVRDRADRVLAERPPPAGAIAALGRAAFQVVEGALDGAAGEAAGIGGFDQLFGRAGAARERGFEEAFGFVARGGALGFGVGRR